MASNAADPIATLIEMTTCIICKNPVDVCVTLKPCNHSGCQRCLGLLRLHVDCQEYEFIECPLCTRWARKKRWYRNHLVDTLVRLQRLGTADGQQCNCPTALCHHLSQVYSGLFFFVVVIITTSLSLKRDTS